MTDLRATNRGPNRDRVVSVRLGEAEYEQLTKAAERRGIKVSGLLRGAALDFVEAHGPGGSEPEAPLPSAPEGVGPAHLLPEVSKEFKRGWVNLNQLTRVANTKGVVEVPEGDGGPRLVEVLTVINARVGEVLVALGHPGH